LLIVGIDREKKGRRYKKDIFFLFFSTVILNFISISLFFTIPPTQQCNMYLRSELGLLLFPPKLLIHSKKKNDFLPTLILADETQQ